MSSRPAMVPEPGVALLDLYDIALPEVYGYLLARCRQAALAEDLTSETFLAAVSGARQRSRRRVEHGLADRRRQAQARRPLATVRTRRTRAARAGGGAEDCVDPWEQELDALLAKEVLARLGPQHRAALTLRYLDGLPVPEVAEHLGRTVHATEALLVRAGTRSERPMRTEHDEGEGRKPMNDPLETLHEPMLPVDPDPTFAAALRAQLAQALLHGTGETMSNETDTTAQSRATSATRRSGCRT